MADSAISALAAASVVATANEFEINEAGASKKVTAAQIRNFIGLITKKLSADLANATTTFAKVTDLDQAVGVGTWYFKYAIRYQSDTLTTGIKFGVSFSGTVTSFVAHSMWSENTTAASSGAASQSEASVFRLKAGGSTRNPSATVAIGQTISVDNINSDMFEIIEGVMVVTVAGNLELYHASEVATTTTVKQDSGLILIKLG